VNEIAIAELRAVIAVAPEPADGDPLTDGEALDAITEFGDSTGDFVSGR
jgi:hypothetical protein